VTEVCRHTEEEQKTSAEQLDSGQQQVLKAQQASEGQLDSEQQQASEAQPTAEKQRTKETPFHTILMFIVKLGVVCLTLWLIFTFAFGIKQMHGETMYPKLRDGDLMLYNRMERNYTIGDVVVFEVNGMTRVARVVAQGGDVVEVTEDGQFLVNGNLQSEEIFYPTEPDASGITYPYTVEEDSYFMLCDFRTASQDSRSYGAIPVEDIYGKVITILRRREI
jgi:signal peptidase I